MERTATWDRTGLDVSGCKTLTGVMKKADLDYEIKKMPVFAGPSDKPESGILIPGRVATVRTDTNKVYGIVSEDYNVCQNIEAFSFVDSIKEDVKFVRAGETGNGLVWIIAKTDKVKILGDEFQPHIIFQNGHNGGYSVKACISPLRIICQNQFTMTFRDTSNTVNIRHTSSMSDRLVEAQTVLKSVAMYMDQLSKEAEKYAKIKLSNEEVTKVIDGLFPITPEMGVRAANNITEKKNRFIAAYNENDNLNFHGNMWGIINAATSYLTHFDSKKPSPAWNDNRFVYITLNPEVTMQMIRKAMEVAAK